MKVLRTLVVGVLVLSLLVAAGYGAFMFLLYSADQSAYTAATPADYNYDEVVSNAQSAGYGVTHEDSTGFHPEGVDQLDARLGPEYEVVQASYHHESGARLEATVFADEGRTELVFWGARYEPVDPNALPVEWMVDRITLMLGVNEATARGYVEEMRAALTDDDVRVAQTYADERLQFEAVYGNLSALGAPEVQTSYDGQGWVEYRYANDGEVVGGFSFMVGRATLTDEEGRRTYVLNVDRTGGIGVTVYGPAGKEIPESELRESVRQRFAEVGIPPEAADELVFEYDPSMW